MSSPPKSPSGLKQPQSPHSPSSPTSSGRTGADNLPSLKSPKGQHLAPRSPLAQAVVVAPASEEDITSQLRRGSTVSQGSQIGSGPASKNASNANIKSSASSAENSVASIQSQTAANETATSRGGFLNRLTNGLYNNIRAPLSRSGSQEKITKAGSMSSIPDATADASSKYVAASPATQKKEDFMRKLLSGRKLDDPPLKTARSLDHVPTRSPPKSILKKRPGDGSAVGSQSSLFNGGGSMASIQDVSSPTSMREGAVIVTSPIESAASPANNESTEPRMLPLLARPQLSDFQHHSSAPDLRVLNIQSSSPDGLKKSGSSKSLKFDLDTQSVIPVHSKTSYNRKPDANITFRKLNDKLKQEIREELNTYKRNEMSVHELSLSNTVFH